MQSQSKPAVKEELIPATERISAIDEELSTCPGADDLD
jgi:hypothetical protein